MPFIPRNRRILAVVLCSALVAGIVGGPVLAAETGALNGRVFGPDGSTPLEGVTVKAAHLATETIFESTATDTDGGFRLADLLLGDYELAVSTAEGLYPARGSFAVDGERVGIVSLAIAPATAEEAEEGEKPETEGDDDPAGPAAQAKKSFWDRPIVATGVVLGFAGVLGYAADEILSEDAVPEEVRASPSGP